MYRLELKNVKFTRTVADTSKMVGVRIKNVLKDNANIHDQNDKLKEKLKTIQKEKRHKIPREVHAKVKRDYKSEKKQMKSVLERERDNIVDESFKIHEKLEHVKQQRDVHRMKKDRTQDKLNCFSEKASQAQKE